MYCLNLGPPSPHTLILDGDVAASQILRWHCLLTLLCKSLLSDLVGKKKSFSGYRIDFLLNLVQTVVILVHFCSFVLGFCGSSDFYWRKGEGVQQRESSRRFSSTKRDIQHLGLS